MAKDWHAGLIRDSKTDSIIVRFKEGGRWRFKALPYKWSIPGDEQKALKLAEEKERQIKAQAQYAEVDGTITVRSFGETWLKGREDLSSYPDDAYRLRNYIYPTLGQMQLGEVRKSHILALVQHLGKRPSRTGGLLAPRTVRSAYGTLAVMFEDASGDGRIAINPCKLRTRRRELPNIRDKDPAWRDTAVFSVEEATQLTHDLRVPLHRRVFYAVLFFGCTRSGEASFLRWHHYDPQAKPLGALHIRGSWQSRLKKEKETKAERPRKVPVMPPLARLLAEWKLSGWAERYGRLPAQDDLLCPADEATTHRSANQSLRQLHADLGLLGLRRRRIHDTRRTWISMVLAAGANETHANWISHGPPPGVMGSYTTLPWPTLCKVVEGLDPIGAGLGSAAI